MLYASELENNTIAVKSAKTVKVLSFNAQYAIIAGFFLQSILSRQKAYLSLTNKIRN